MTTGIPIHLTPGQSWEPISRDWFNQPTLYRPAFQLTLTEETLAFRFKVDKPPECDLNHRRGQFVEGLWEREVAELFVMAPSGRYQEFNVSPAGAWWSASFSAYREREKSLDGLSVRTLAKPEAHSWEVELQVPVRDLVVLDGFELDQARWNVTAILSPEEPTYLSWGRIEKSQPDFHRADLFSQAVLIRP